MWAYAIAAIFFGFIYTQLHLQSALFFAGYAAGVFIECARMKFCLRHRGIQL